MAQEGRRVWVQVWKNLISSFGFMRQKSVQVGEDRFGTRYFEIPADPQRGKRKASRWFETKVPNTFDQELPAEWEAWLRGRRKQPPTVEEINRNVAMMTMAKTKAKELEDKENANKEKSGPILPTQEEERKFPTYEEYEHMPGTPSDKTKR